ncbi:MAG: YdhR family protein [Acidobacteria bacterium]|nr:YdhR family protein [Acidobacteriota bacterium]
MSAKILQINFKFSAPRDAYEQTVAPMASDFATVPGSRRKIWLMHETESEAGGICQYKNGA